MALKKRIDADKICENLWFLRNLRPAFHSLWRKTVHGELFCRCLLDQFPVNRALHILGDSYHIVARIAQAPGNRKVTAFIRKKTQAGHQACTGASRIVSWAKLAAA